jgi:hypothetical protein
MIVTVAQAVLLSGRRSVDQWCAMTEEGEKERPLRELLFALLDALKDALLALRPQTLFVTDTDMIRRIGVPEKIARAAIRALDENPLSGFPQKSELWGNRRYWPAVEAWFREQQDLDTKKPRLR